MFLQTYKIDSSPSNNYKVSPQFIVVDQNVCIQFNMTLTNLHLISSLLVFIYRYALFDRKTISSPKKTTKFHHGIQLYV